MAKKTYTFQSRFSLAKLFFLAVAAALIYYISPFGSTHLSKDALQEAINLIDDKQFKKAEKRLDAAEAVPEIRHWLKLQRARLLEAEEKFVDAVAHYEQIGPGDASFPDALLGQIRLWKHKATSHSLSPTTEELGEVVTRLQQLLLASNRRDLIPELHFIRAENAAATGHIELAYSLHQELRKQFPGTAFAHRSRLAVQALASEFPSFFEDPPMPALLSEAELLLAENEPVTALEALQKGLSGLAPNTNSYFQAKLLEDKILRRLNRHAEADRLLSIISSQGGSGTADAALLQMAKNAWNTNDTEKAKQLVENLTKRFRGSVFEAEATYLKARVLEETGASLQAADLYKQLAERVSNPPEKVLALRQLAWIYLKEENFSSAAKYFSALTSVTEKLLEQPQQESSTLKRSDLEIDRLHGLYWLAFSLQQQSTPPVTGPTRNELLQQVYHDSPFSYYGQKAYDQLKQSSDLPPLISTARPNDPALLLSCFETVPEALSTRLGILSSSGLKEFAQHEINWHFYQNPITELENEASSLQVLTPTRRSLTETYLLLNHAPPKTAISSLQSLISKEQARARRNPELAECLLALRVKSFPTPESSTFELAANETKVPLSLLYAIARTESHFEYEAESTSGAKGLMQVMAATAKDYGWSEEQDLFNPKLNIPIGAKHLAKLLSTYGGIEVYAVAAYNAGATPISRWKERYPKATPEQWAELIAFPETKNYVKKVIAAERMYRELLDRKN